MDKEPELAVLVLGEWNKSQNLWKARASLVPFAQSRKIERHTETILQFSTDLIKRHERFCKTAVGWVLREYSKIDTMFVTGFLEQYNDWTTKEMITKIPPTIPPSFGNTRNRRFLKEYPREMTFYGLEAVLNDPANPEISMEMLSGEEIERDAIERINSVCILN